MPAWIIFALPASPGAALTLGLAALLVPACGERSLPCGGGSGSWRAGALEIHHLPLGQADATLIVAPGGRSLLVDVGEPRPDSAEGATQVGEAVERVLGCRSLDQILITHFHQDHLGVIGRGGLWHLLQRQGFQTGRFYHRDLARHSGEDGPTQRAWRGYLAGKGVAARLADAELVARAGQSIDLGPEVAVRVVATDGAGALRPGPLAAGAGPGAAPPSENDYSVALHLRFGRLDYFLGGDLSGEHVTRGAVSYHDVETVVARGLADMDVYRVNHHGSEHSSNPTFLGQIDPQVAIVSAGAGNPHGHPHLPTLRRLMGTGAVYLTDGGSRAGLPAGVRVGGGQGVLVRSLDGTQYTVDGDVHQADDPGRIDGDGDGYFREVDPDDSDPRAIPAPFGGCDPVFQRCGTIDRDQPLVSGGQRD